MNSKINKHLPLKKIKKKFLLFHFKKIVKTNKIKLIKKKINNFLKKKLHIKNTKRNQKYKNAKYIKFKKFFKKIISVSKNFKKSKKHYFFYPKPLYTILDNEKLFPFEIDSNFFKFSNNDYINENFIRLTLNSTNLNKFHILKFKNLNEKINKNLLKNFPSILLFAIQQYSINNSLCYNKYNFYYNKKNLKNKNNTSTANTTANTAFNQSINFLISRLSFKFDLKKLKRKKKKILRRKQAKHMLIYQSLLLPLFKNSFNVFKTKCQIFFKNSSNNLKCHKKH
jgi:hypothetical protein